MTRKWVLDHVRTGKAEAIAEIESFGLELVEDVEVPGIEENCVLRFPKR